MMCILTCVQKLIIGDSTFQMHSQPETTHHELYVRMVNPQKPTQAAPLRLMANVVGKFMVERELGTRVETAVRDRTQQAQEQKRGRKIELLDEPLPVSSTKAVPSKKSKQSAKPQRSTPAGFAQSDTHRSQSSVQSSRIASPRPSPRPSSSSSPDDIVSTKSRVLHCVAIQPRTPDQIFAFTAVEQSHRQEVAALISEVCLSSHYRRPSTDAQSLVIRACQPSQRSQVGSYQMASKT